MALSKEVYNLVEMMCTAEQIQGLLRARKGADGVRITAENKDDLIRRNLREALESKAISEDEVFDLIRNAEENGSQHIFYFRCSKAYGSKLSLDLVGQNLWGRDWSSKMSFPKHELQENDFIWADARPWNPTKKPRDWAVKVYGDEVYYRFLGESHEKSDKLLIKKYAVERKRRVLLARWNDPDILELRVPSDESRRRVLGWVQRLWNMLQVGLQRGEFKEWDLTTARRNLVAKAQHSTAHYSTRDTTLVDPHSTAVTFNPHSPQGHLFESEATRTAIEGLLKAKSGCAQLSVTWMARDGVLSKDLRTFLGGMARVNS